MTNVYALVMTAAPYTPCMYNVAVMVRSFRTYPSAICIKFTAKLFGFLNNNIYTSVGGTADGVRGSQYYCSWLTQWMCVCTLRTQRLRSNLSKDKLFIIRSKYCICLRAITLLFCRRVACTLLNTSATRTLYETINTRTFIYYI